MPGLGPRRVAGFRQGGRWHRYPYSARLISCRPSHIFCGLHRDRRRREVPGQTARRAISSSQRRFVEASRCCGLSMALRSRFPLACASDCQSAHRVACRIATRLVQAQRNRGSADMLPPPWRRSKGDADEFLRHEFGQLLARRCRRAGLREGLCCDASFFASTACSAYAARAAQDSCATSKCVRAPLRTANATDSSAGSGSIRQCVQGYGDQLFA